MMSTRAVWLSLLLLPLAACEAPADDGGEGEDEGDAGDEGEGEGDAGEGEGEGEGVGISYFADVKPLIEQKCLACHVEGGIAPFTLTDPQDVVALASFLAETVEARTMPPWMPSALSPSMRDDISLTPEQIAVFRAFADAVEADVDDPPLGDPADAPPPPEPEGFSLASVTPDVSVEVGEAFVPTGLDSGEDEFRCFLLDMDVPAERVLIGHRFRPGNNLVDHHAILTLYSRDDLAAIQGLDDADAGSGWSCFGEDVPADVARPVGTIGAWTPGNDGVAAFPGTGLPIPANVIVVASMHYNVANVIGADGVVDLTRASDQSGLDLWFAPVDDADGLLRTFGVARNLNRQLRAEAAPVPADASAHVIQETVAIADIGAATRTVLENAGIDTVYVTGVSAHGHLILKHFEIIANEGRADEVVLLDIPAWDFDWQGQYTFVDDVPLSIETALTVRCTYDNSSDNRARVGLDPTSVTVVAGESTRDEMCIGALQFVVRDPTP